MSRFAFKITVNGPGQYLSVSLVKICNSSSVWGKTSYKADFVSKTWTIIGSVNGLLFTLYMSNNAASFVASAPNPYTV